MEVIISDWRKELAIARNAIILLLLFSSISAIISWICKDLYLTIVLASLCLIFSVAINVYMVVIFQRRLHLKPKGEEKKDFSPPFFFELTNRRELVEPFVGWKKERTLKQPSWLF